MRHKKSMKRNSFVIWALVGMLILLATTSIYVMVTNNENPTVMMQDMVALLIAVFSVSLAIAAQLGARRTAEAMDKVMRELDSIRKEENLDEKVDEKMLAKLAQIANYDRKLSEQVDDVKRAVGRLEKEKK